MSIDPDAPAAGSPGETDEGEPQVVTPVVVDLGKVRRKHVKRLKRGEGKLAEEVRLIRQELEGGKIQESST